MSYFNGIVHIPLWIYLLDLILLLGIVLILFFSFLLRRRIKKSILSSINSAENQPGKIPIDLPVKVFYAYSDYIEKLSRLYGLNLPHLTGLDNLWIEKLKKRPRGKYIRRLLKYVPEKALFEVMNSVLKKESLKKYFTEWIEQSGEFLILKKIAVSGNGRSFDGKKAAGFFKNEIDSLIEMMADPLWQCRYFAASILVHDRTAVTDRVLRESFHDSHKKIRITIINHYQSDDRKFIYKNLLDLFLSDPVFEVRKAAKRRIDRNFKNIYKIDPEKLTTTQKLHLIELLNPASKNDENIGLNFLKSDNRELELYASRYLSRTGTLSRLFKTADPGDTENFNRTFALLNTAVRVNCTDFLNEIMTVNDSGPLLLASRFLKYDGNRSLITDLIKKVSVLYEGQTDSPVINELYTNTLLCACLRGNDNALEAVNKELIKRKDSAHIQKTLLPLLPERGDAIFTPTLLNFLEDTRYPARDVLIETLVRYPSSLILPELTSIIHNNDVSYDYTIKIGALQILGKMKEGYGIQYVLENLPLLSLEEAKKYTGLLAEHSSEYFDERVETLLASHDAEIRSHIIAALPKKSIKQFLTRIIYALEDSAPEVRISCVWALADFSDRNSFKKCFSLLHDPVENVRIETVKAISLYGAEEGMLYVRKTLFDRIETASVKKAAICGLGESGASQAFDLLTEKLLEGKEFITEIKAALIKYNNPENIRKLFELMEGAPPKGRKRLEEILHNLGQKAESIAKEILLEGNGLLKEYAVMVLENSGFIDMTVRKLSHRDPEERYRAAEFLYLVGNKKAYRGLISAAKDPVEKIRTLVIKAVDRLNTREGNILLEDLKDDPDKKVRRYTLWALERIEAKELSG